MKRAIPLLVLVALSLALLSCSGGKITTPALIPNIAGAWEFLATPNPNPNNCGSSGTDPCQTGIEVALQEGQTPINGFPQPNGSLSAGSTQIAFVTIDGTTGNASSFGGSCPPTSTPINSLTGSVSAFGGPFNFTYTENGNAFTVTGMLSGDGKTLLNATYTAQSGSSCNQSGSISGTVVSKLSGMYTGQLTLPDNSNDTATATLSESSSSVLTLNLVMSGQDNTTFTLTGPVTGNAFSVQGTFQGQAVTYNGYSELTFDTLTQAFDIPSLYLVNATNAAQPDFAGLLTVPQNPAIAPRN
jgi:hypothetical protein